MIELCRVRRCFINDDTAGAGAVKLWNPLAQEWVFCESPAFTMKRFLPVFTALSLALVPATPAAELQHLWDFEGEMWGQDKVGMAHGEVTKTSTLMQVVGTGDTGSAMSVEKTIGSGDDHLVVAASELYQPGAEAFSFTFWINMPDDGSSEPRGIFDFSGNGRDGVQSLYIGTSNELAFRVDAPGSTFSLVKVPALLEDGEWHFVAATYDPAVGLEVHIDGFGVDGTAAAATGNISMDADCYIGSFNFNPTAPANKGLGGSIDDLAIYSGVLTQEEIETLSQPRIPTLEPIGSITYVDGKVDLTWKANDGQVFSLWQSVDLLEWSEIDDSIVADASGGSYGYDVPEPRPGRLYFQLRRGE